MSLTPDMMPVWELREHLKDRDATITRLTAEVERLGRDYETARDAHDRRVRELDTHCTEVAVLRAEVAWPGVQHRVLIEQAIILPLNTENPDAEA